MKTESKAEMLGPNHEVEFEIPSTDALTPFDMGLLVTVLTGRMLGRLRDASELSECLDRFSAGLEAGKVRVVRETAPKSLQVVDVVITATVTPRTLTANDQPGFSALLKKLGTWLKLNRRH